MWACLHIMKLEEIIFLLLDMRHAGKNLFIVNWIHHTSSDVTSLTAGPDASPDLHYRLQLLQTAVGSISSIDIAHRRMLLLWMVKNMVSDLDFIKDFKNSNLGQFPAYLLRNVCLSKEFSHDISLYLQFPCLIPDFDIASDLQFICRFLLSRGHISLSLVNNNLHTSNSSDWNVIHDPQSRVYRS